MQRALALLVVVVLTPGCSCSSTPMHACESSSDCAAGATCVDRHCVTGVDAGARDLGASDATDVDATDVDATTPPVDASVDLSWCVPVSCAATESCFNGVDDDCNGAIDEGCGCIPGSTARCLPGRPDPTTPRCGWGEMTCAGSGEFGSWGPCSGASADGGSSLYGCRRIGIMGAPGANLSSNFQAWLGTQGAIVTRFQDTAAAPTLHIEELETFDLVIVDWLQRTYSAAEADTLASWVRAGGGLFVMTGHDSGGTADRHVSLLASLGPSYDLAAGPIDGPATLLAHPTTLAADGVSTLPPVTFYGGLRVTVPAALSADVVPIAVIGSEVVGAAGPIGSGRVLLFGDEWIEFDSEWATMPPIPQLWQDAVQWLSPDAAGLPACP